MPDETPRDTQGEDDLETLLGSLKDDDEFGLVEDEDAGEEADATLRLVQLILLKAIERGATEVHFDPTADGLLVRVRRDGGRLQEILRAEARAVPVLGRLKIMAALDISERRLPQDGRIVLRSDRYELDCFFATLPTTRGERAILRLGVKTVEAPDLAEREVPEATLALLRHALTARCGLIVTGCAVRDRRDLLWALTREVDPQLRLVALVSDRPLVTDERILAVQLADRVHFGPAAALRATARQGSDLIFVDRSLTREELELATELAAEERVVVVGIPVDDPAGALARVVSAGLDPEDLAESLSLVVTETRLARLCAACRRETPTGWEASGCEHCIDGRRGDVYVYRAVAADQRMRAALTDEGEAQDALEALVRPVEETFRARLEQLARAGEIALEDVARE